MSKFVPARDAVDVLTELALPQCETAADALTPAVLALVPVNDGAMLRSFAPSTEPTEQGARWYPNSPMWHWLEYGTRWNAPYRPIQNGAESLGLRYVAT